MVNVPYSQIPDTDAIEKQRGLILSEIDLIQRENALILSTLSQGNYARSELAVHLKKLLKTKKWLGGFLGPIAVASSIKDLYSNPDYHFFKTRRIGYRQLVTENNNRIKKLQIRLENI